MTYLLAITGITIGQAIFPEVLLTSVVVTLMVIGVYLNQEDPVLTEISRYHSEMVMSFAVPDVVLQKPGRLTEEEFEIIKKHTEDGSRIIEETFGNLRNKEYTRMAYEVARYHHEKWNGKGYPDGLKQSEIPLCARVMAVADVFDPMIAEVFLDSREKVEQIHNEINTKQ